MEQIVVNSQILCLYDQNEISFDKVSFREIVNDIQIVEAEFDGTNMIIWMGYIDSLDLKRVIFDQIRNRAKQTDIIYIIDSKGKLTDFVVTNNQVKDTMFYILSQYQTSQLELDGFKLTNNSVIDYSNI